MRLLMNFFSIGTCIGISCVILVVLSVPAVTQDNSTQKGIQLSPDEPVQILGDKLTMLDEQRKAIIEGNVEVVQGETVLRTGYMEVFYAQSGGLTDGSQIERIEMQRGVNIQSGTQIATGEQGTMNMQTQIFELSGERVTLSDQGNIATGCKLKINMETSITNLEGCGASSRPTVLIRPKSIQN